jgi:3-oxoacyl-[acyl-carrier-protein] synthase-1
LTTWVGRVDGLEQVALPESLSAWDSRPTRLAWQALQADGFAAAVQAARDRWGRERIGLVLGSTASTVIETERAYRMLAAGGAFPAALQRPEQNNPHALTAFVQTALELAGPCITVSAACASSAKAFACAERWLRLGLVDAVVVAGVDALCASLLYGFRALGLVSAEPCRPFGVRRQGISVGEAAGFALLERGPARLQLLGYGVSNDAHHMSTPHPQGLGAEEALDGALARAGLAACDIDFVNLHGTASVHSDEVEAALLARRYAAGVHACATKGLTGHTMGAAGIVEAAVCLLALEGQVLAGCAHTGRADPAFGHRFAEQLRLLPVPGRARVAAKHALGFGGNNCVLLFGRGGEEAV